MDFTVLKLGRPVIMVPSYQQDEQISVPVSPSPRPPMSFRSPGKERTPCSTGQVRAGRGDDPGYRLSGYPALQ